MPPTLLGATRSSPAGIVVLCSLFFFLLAAAAARAQDTDADGIPNAIELGVIGLDPNDPDSDADGLCDGSLTVAGTCDAGEDLSNDGVVDAGETDPTNPDTDADTICDGSGTGGGSCTAGPDNCPLDANVAQTDTDLDGLGDVCDPDDDADGVLDGVDNCPLDANPAQTNTDGDGQGDACDSDDDNDGVADGADNCPLDANSGQTDTDGDGQGDVCDSDDDGDGVADGADNCPLNSNSDQTDTDGDGEGDACDIDDDGDGVIDATDNCPLDANLPQTDTDGDGQGDVCDLDDDGDGIGDGADNCPLTPNPTQTDTDGDGAGDACDVDIDADAIPNASDNCPLDANFSQADTDGDGQGDACDACPNDAQDDGDSDGFCSDVDNCPAISNPTQADADADGLGDACDVCPNDAQNDSDGDGACSDVDNCPAITNPTQADADLDGLGNACDACPLDAQNDVDGDGICGDVDNCPAISNPTQTDIDFDGIGDVCDPDDDEDGVPDISDNCPTAFNPTQADSDSDGIGDVCDLPQRKISGTAGGFTGTLDNADLFGYSIASIGDLDGDGVTDLAVGAPLDDDGGSSRGAIWVLFLNSDGTVKAHQKISDHAGGFTGFLSNFDQFGSSVAALGDLDGDGVKDLAVGAPADDDGAANGDRGAVWILFLNTDGTVKAHQKISDSAGSFSGALSNADDFGIAVASLGDLDDDGVADLAVGASGDDDGAIAGDRGAVWVLFLNADGTVKSHQKISDTLGGFAGVLNNIDRFGNALASLGDLDGDGVGDLAVGSRLNDDGALNGNRGAVWILFLNIDGSVKAEQKISDTAGGFAGLLDNSDEFGASVASLGDLDGDGVGELAVGAYGDDDGGANRGAVWLLFLHSDGTVKSEQKLSDTAGTFTGVLDNGDQFGFSATPLGDLDGDGAEDLGVGAFGDDDGGSSRGAAWLLMLTENLCGNGILDSGEQCDLGAANRTLGSCCTGSCTFEPATSICRESAGGCDAVEACTGFSSACPADGFEPVTTLCRGPAGVCDIGEFCDGASAACPADVKGMAECRPSAGPCDVPEICDGVADTCPTDAFQPVATVCQPQAGPCDVEESCTGLGPSCPPDAKSTAECRASIGPCDPAEVCDGAGDLCPADGRSTDICRSALGPCDPPEFCDGVNETCPTDSKSTAECRASAGPCDIPEVCDGVSDLCPANLFRPATLACRPAAGDCDLAELCTGNSAACPADVKSTAECRASLGPCDPAEVCDGLADVCAADAKSTAECRASVGVCDLAELCDGVADTCPADSKSTAGCRAAAGPCDLVEFCNGVSDSCPADAKSTDECRAAIGPCDAPESCDGASDTCPADALVPAGTECRAQAGSCDVAEGCTGSSAACPPDFFQPATVECRASAGICDLPELCTGSVGLCPPDLKSSAECRPSAGQCDLADLCDGVSDSCPLDAKSTGSCRPAAGPCDSAEFCDGFSNACPGDALKPPSTECRPQAGPCDVLEFCTGGSIACPADLVEPDGLACDDANLCTLDDMCAAGVCVGDPGVTSPATCGDGILQLACGEQCDDGNFEDCDGCSTRCEREEKICGAQTSSQVKCISALNQGLASVAKAQGKLIRACIQDGAKGKLSGPIEDCVTLDGDGRVQKAQQRTSLQEFQDCTVTPPDFASTNAATVNTAAVQGELDIIHDVFGPDLDLVIVPADIDKDAYNCQRQVVKAIEKCRSTRFKEFNRCKKLSLRRGDVTDAASLRSACLDADPKFKIAKFCTPPSSRLETIISKKCAGVALSAAFGPCNTDDPGQLAVCIDELIACHTCMALAKADDFGSLMCDLLDNGIDDSSCGDIPPSAIASKCGPGSHWIDSPCAAGLDLMVDTSAFIGIDQDGDCVADLSVTLTGDLIVQRSASLDRSSNFPGPSDCNGGPCGVVDGHLDVIDTEIISMNLGGAGVVLKAGDAASVLLSASRGTVFEGTDPALAKSLFDIFFELEVDGTKLYNHDPVRVQADTEYFPPDATYLHVSGCVPLFDDPGAGAQLGALVMLEPSTNRCGNDVAGDREQCDGTDDASCPGQCQPDCTCP